MNLSRKQLGDMNCLSCGRKLKEHHSRKAGFVCHATIQTLYINLLKTVREEIEKINKKASEISQPTVINQAEQK